MFTDNLGQAFLFQFHYLIAIFLFTFGILKTEHIYLTGSEELVTGSEEFLIGLANLQYSSGDLPRTFSKLQMLIRKLQSNKERERGTLDLD